jgi:FAD/FMN-containing dehydrogenase
MVVSVAYFGDVDEGRTAIRALTDGTAPIADGVRPMYYPELQEIFGRMPFGLRNYWSGRFLREFSDDVVELTADTFAGPETMGGVLVEPLHGAASRVPPDATAFAGREASHNATFISTWTDPAEDERRIAGARTYSAALAPGSIGEGYVNYASEMPEDVPVTERIRRLRRIKRQYDPENRFRFNHNIEPA